MLIVEATNAITEYAVTEQDKLLGRRELKAMLSGICLIWFGSQYNVK